MSRIGKLPVVLAPKVEAKILDNVIEVSGPLWTLKTEIHELVSVSVEDGKVTVTPQDLENPLSKILMLCDMQLHKFHLNYSVQKNMLHYKSQ